MRRKLGEILRPNPEVRFGRSTRMNIGHWMEVKTHLGETLQVFEHGEGIEGGTAILLRSGTQGSNLKSVSHDPSEYMFTNFGGAFSSFPMQVSIFLYDAGNECLCIVDPVFGKLTTFNKAYLEEQSGLEITEVKFCGNVYRYSGLLLCSTSGGCFGVFVDSKGKVSNVVQVPGFNTEEMKDFTYDSDGKLYLLSGSGPEYCIWRIEIPQFQGIFPKKVLEIESGFTPFLLGEWVMAGPGDLAELQFYSLKGGNTLVDLSEMTSWKEGAQKRIKIASPSFGEWVVVVYYEVPLTWERIYSMTPEEGYIGPVRLGENSVAVIVLADSVSSRIETTDLGEVCFLTGNDGKTFWGVRRGILSIDAGQIEQEAEWETD